MLNYLKCYRKFRGGNWKLVEIQGFRFPHYEVNIFWLRNFNEVDISIKVIYEEDY